MAKKKKTGNVAAPTGRKKPVAKKPAAKRVVAKRVTATRTAAKPARATGAQRGGTNLRSLAPGFTVNDIETSLAWYRDVLGFAVKERWEDAGTLQGAEMASGNVSIMLGQDDWKQGRDRVKGQGVRMYITTERLVDGLASQIKARGGILAQEPMDGWGMRTFAIVDPDGYKLTYMFTVKK